MNLTSVILRTFSSYAENVFILYNVNKHVDILYVTSLVHVETSHFGNHSNNFKFKRKGACSRFTLFRNSLFCYDKVPQQAKGKSVLESVKKIIKEKLGDIKEKRASFFQEIQFLLKGVEMGEEILRVLKIVCVMGLVLFSILLAGKTIQYITKEKTQVLGTNQMKQNKIKTDADHKNPNIEEQYSKFVKQVENLIQENELKREKNLTGDISKSAKNGQDGKNGNDGNDGVDGKDGKSAYLQAVEAGYTGTEEEFTRTIISAENRIKVVENGIQNVTDSIHDTNNHIKTTNDILNDHINQMQQTIGNMHENFQNGCNIISAAITAKGVDTPPNSTPDTMAEHIGRLAEAHYKQGYVDGAASMENVDVEYEYHYHDGNEQSGGACFTDALYHTHDSQSCFGICTNKSLNYVKDYYDGNHDHRYVYKCSVCGFEYGSYGSEGDRYSRIHVSASPICGMPENQVLGYQCTCGMSDGQIISAKIIY